MKNRGRSFGENHVLEEKTRHRTKVKKSVLVEYKSFESTIRIHRQIDRAVIYLNSPYNS